MRGFETTHDADATRVELLAHAQDQGLLYDHVLQRYTLHAVLARLADTRIGTLLTLTGGTALAARLGPDHRRLFALDLRVGDPEALQMLPDALRESVDSDDDGLVIDPGSIHVRKIDRGASRTRRLTAVAYLGTAVIPVRVDAELGDPVQTPDVLEVDPPLPGAELVVIAVAGMETVFAEAVEQLVRRGPLRVRMCDIYDAWMACHVDPLDDLETILRSICESRGTVVPDGVPHVLSCPFGKPA